jgi:predicted PurR-regulated permease PerM
VLRDLQQFAGEMPTRVPALLSKLKAIPLADHLNTDEITAKVQDFASQAATYLILSIRDWAGNLLDIAMGLILTIYFMLEGEHAYRWFLSFFPPESRDRLDKTLRRAEIRMGKWLFAQGSLMLILGLFSTTVYLALDVRYAYALGVLTGLMNIIPVLGAAICIALALLVAAIDSWGRVLGIAVFYLVYLQVENSYLTPRIMKKSVDLPGLAILVALLMGSALAGVVGAMVSVPTGHLEFAGSLGVEDERGEFAGQVEVEALGDEDQLAAGGDDDRAFAGGVDLLLETAWGIAGGLPCGAGWRRQLEAGVLAAQVCRRRAGQRPGRRRRFSMPER